jgi:hypothetical protein
VARYGQRPAEEEPMKPRLAAVLAFVCCFSAGCIVGFKYPLGPVKKAVMDARLLGVWECHDADEKPARLTFMDYDDRQFVLYLTAEGDEPSHFRSYSTRIKGHVFLNLQEVKPKRVEPAWLFFEYAFSADGRLSLRGVNASPFEKVQENEKEVRRLLERNLGNPEFFESTVTCAKAD